MKISDLELETTKDRKRVGRGIGSGYGKTAGRGTKGQNSRTGGGVRPGFEGGQNPLSKRLPKKRGFVPRVQVLYQVVNVESLERLKEGTLVDAATLTKAGLIKHEDGRIKLLARGELTKQLTVQVHASSASAIAIVEKAGGKVEVIDYVKAHSKKATRPKTEEALQA
jgi:large subunit ribosomal protein L15